jgi:GTP diphosphokinase / guanosine-3',5'-bis(diphosphate) 3'-diphosphatase
MTNLPLIIDALAFASHAHRDQRRKGVDASPYISHPIALARILVVEGGIDDPVVIAAALLHDTIEDCSVTKAELDARFGAEVAGVVNEVTDDKSLPKARRKELQVEYAAHISARAKLVKLSDKIANVRDIAERPPSDWSSERKHEYAEWAKRVVDGLRGTHPGLEAAFDAAARAVIDSEDDYYDTFEGRGQDEQDQHALDNDLLPDRLPEPIFKPTPPPTSSTKAKSKPPLPK